MKSSVNTDKTEREKETRELYALDISGASWTRLGDAEDPGAAELAELEPVGGPKGSKALRSAAEPDTVLRYTEREWVAFVNGAKDGEFDLKPPACDVQYGTGQVSPQETLAFCHRREEHPPVSDDGIGHWGPGDYRFTENPDEEMR